jgi:hypothetical protein
MNPEPEIRRLLDVMPASGRMMTKIISKPQQSTVIDSPYPLPWKPERLIYINFDLWRRLSKSQRDLLILRTQSWLCGVKWFKPELYQGVALAGIFGAIAEGVQGDAIGLVIAGGLAGLGLMRIWQSSRSPQLELDADEMAIRIAGRRGYHETEAAGHLLSAIEIVANIEGRLSLNFTELIRSQNLRAIAGLSPVGVPETLRQERT